MKLSNDTLTVLKNFSEINSGLQFKKGKTIRTISTARSIMAEAVVNDEFPQDFCVHDLNNFLAVHSISKDTEVNFTDSNIIFNGNRSVTRYRMTEKKQIVTPPEKNIVIGTPDVSFDLSKDDYASILKIVSVLSSPNIAIQSEGDTIDIIAFDFSDDSANVNSTKIAEGNGKKFKIIFKTENIKMLPGSYTVQISFKGFVHFKNTNGTIEYWVASEKDSVTGE
jgi:hypothetical protein